MGIFREGCMRAVSMGSDVILVEPVTLLGRLVGVKERFVGIQSKDKVETMGIPELRVSPGRRERILGRICG